MNLAQLSVLKPEIPYVMYSRSSGKKHHDTTKRVTAILTLTPEILGWIAQVIYMS